MENPTELKNIIHQAASRYLAAGIAVIPLTSPSQPNGGKRPALRGWQSQPIAQLPTGSQNVGIRQGQQPNGRYRLTFDFDRDAASVFPAFVAKCDAVGVSVSAVAQSGSQKGYHAYFETESPVETQKLAAAELVNGQPRPIIECLHTSGHQVVAPPSLHPTSGQRYRLLSGSVTQPPILNPQQLQDVLAIAASFDKRAASQPSSGAAWPALPALPDNLDGLTLSAQIQSIAGGELTRRTDGQFHLRGHGGLIIDDAKSRWYIHAEGVGGGDIVSFIAARGGIPYREALARLRQPQQPLQQRPGQVLIDFVEGVLATQRQQLQQQLQQQPQQPPDAFDEDWYAHECKAQGRLIVNVPAGSYLSDIDFKLPQFSVLEARTGIGKTTYAARRRGVVIIVMSSVVAVQQQHQHTPGSGVWYEKVKQTGQKTFVTYEGFPALVVAMRKSGHDTKDILVFVDEQHNLGLAGYRRKALGKLLDALQAHEWRGVCFMSGTPLSVPHAYLDGFQHVIVNSPQRAQTAVMVQWRREIERVGDGEELLGEGGEPREAEYTGSKRDTVVTLAMRHERVLVHLNDKSGKLDRHVAALVAAGVDVGTIYKLNSDTKYETIGRHIVEYETVPDDCRVLFVTDVFVESANMQTVFDAVIICDAVHPAHAQQLVNRQRGERPPGVVYVLNSGTGAGWGLDMGKELAHTRQQSAVIAAALSDLQAARREIDDTARAVFGGSFGGMVAYDAPSASYVADELGVAQHCHESLKMYCKNNPQAFKNATTQYGWKWLPDAEVVVVAEDKADDQRDRERELTNEYALLASENWLERVAAVAALTPQQAENAMLSSQPPPKVKRVLQRALELEELTGDWSQACALLATGKDSTQSYHRLLNTIHAQQFRKAGDPFTLELLAAFEPAVAYTQAERHAKLVAVYNRHPRMAPFVTPNYRFSWSKDARAKIDPREADRILRLLFTVTTERSMVDGDRARLWRLHTTNPLVALLWRGMDILRGVKPEQSADCPPNSCITKPLLSLVGKKGGNGRQKDVAAMDIDAVVAEVPDCPPNSSIIKPLLSLVGKKGGNGQPKDVAAMDIDAVVAEVPGFG